VTHLSFNVHQSIDRTYKNEKAYVMQSKLTLRMEDSVIRKAKRLARKKGKSVSRMVSDYIAQTEDTDEETPLPPVTASMLGVLAGKAGEADEDAYRQYLAEKHL